ncbi:ferric-chelate reductase [Microdochium trichocladiopsis]|uniref:Ferric-chelate reductase n=1 Tax=Microdochium trichocladiopsis TaxID=1682393 RepID=A0A9P8Y4M7_9PEZI|nr:ferric-chelate reductase [Microdochium trichocladiopsis]KAH7028965.1 ferric-chelate reductase [Microdochium trichocladiopsis]
MESLEGRHIQNMSAAMQLEPHWGYADRALPCTGDSCEYLDLVYAAHDYSMLYCGIMYSVVFGVLLLWASGRRLWPRHRNSSIITTADVEKTTEVTLPTAATSWRVRSAITATCRRRLLPEATRAVFGRTTRLQVLILAVIAAYLIVFSFAGMWYRQWFTAAKNSEPGTVTTRTTLGPWSNRVGVLAYALTPFSIMLSSRESLLSVLTGLPYQSFNFLHRWLGYIIVAQGVLHTAGWLVVELKLYQPQPYVPLQLFKEVYMWWGCIATFLLLVLFALSTPWAVRQTGYEFFRKAHYVLAMVYIGSLYGHWDKLSCFLIPALLLWGLDRLVRLARTALVHHQFVSASSSLSLGFRPAQAEMTLFPDAEHGDVVRLDFQFSQDPWAVGQHFYLCFPACSIWQSHPFTPLSLPRLDQAGTVTHSYIIRAKAGETRKLAQLAAAQQENDKKAAQHEETPTNNTTPVVLSGSYGESITATLTPDINVLCIAGGTGITYVLPVLLELAAAAAPNNTPSHVGERSRRIELVWAVRRRKDLMWVAPELARLREAAGETTHGIAVHIFVTREGEGEPDEEKETVPGEGEASSSDVADKETGGCSGSSSSLGADSSPVQQQQKKNKKDGRHPDLQKIVGDFRANTIRGSTTVFASGPGGMLSDLQSIVAACNSGRDVWKGDQRGDVRLVCDDRMEW